MACACCKGRHEPYIRSALPRATVMVSLGGSSSSVRLAALGVRRASGRRFVSLADVWWAASLPVDPARLRIDLVGDDGFETAAKNGAPLSGALLDRARVDLETRDVSWEIDVPCYFRIKGLASLLARPSTTARTSPLAAWPTTPRQPRTAER
jgi:hypothetical protein